jgi:hypothetical protein
MLISIQMERYVILQMSHEKLRYGGEVTFLQPLSLSLSLSHVVSVFSLCAGEIRMLRARSYD